MAASTAAAKKKLVVCGGNGFLGSRICKAAVARDWDVVSIRYTSPERYEWLLWPSSIGVCSVDTHANDKSLDK
jgi:nucleoside-diphosphate-sugar epimerase